LRRALDRLYDGCIWLAGLCMVLILVNVLIQVFGGIFDWYVRGTDAVAGYCMAGASFFALAHTLKRGEHIRVTLVLQRFTGQARRWIELWCLGIATVLAGTFAWYSWKLCWWSYQFNSVSDAQDRAPLWIPQLTMAIGVTVLFIAFLDELVAVLLGRDPAQADQSAEPLHIE
jgi:TRAP-type C4-dicarboxylate transport system permease small subunit